MRAEAWYENETAEFGDRFLAAVEATVVRNSRWPNVGKPVVIAPDGAVVNRKLSAAAEHALAGLHRREVVLVGMMQRRGRQDRRPADSRSAP